MTDYPRQHERLVLSAVLLDNTVLDEIELKAIDFGNKTHRDVFQAILNIVDKGQTADLVTLYDELRTTENTEITAVYIAELTNDIPTTANVSHYAHSVRNASRKRRIKLLQLQIQDWLKEAESDDILEHIERELMRISSDDGGDIKLLSEFLHPAIQEIEDSYNHKGRLKGLACGYRDIDMAMCGLEKECLYIIASRTSIGKTALALCMIANIVRNNNRVGLFSCEMSGSAVASRIIATESRVDLQRIRYGDLGAGDFDKITTTVNAFKAKNVLIDDTPNIKLAKLKSRARKMKRMGVDIIFVDYLTLINFGESSLPRHERVGQIAKELKQLARELKIPIVALSQLNRTAENGTPGLDTLRQSGEIEEDADSILILQRDRDNSADNQLTTVTIAKNRNGPWTELRLVFRAKTTRFENHEDHE